LTSPPKKKKKKKRKRKEKNNKDNKIIITFNMHRGRGEKGGGKMRKNISMGQREYRLYERMYPAYMGHILP